MAHLFTLANNLTVAVSPPLALDTETVIWTSANVTQGSTLKIAKIICNYNTIVPDVEDPANQPSGLRLLFMLEQEQEDNSWQEIGRQNQPITKLNQGTTRVIICAAGLIGDEGIDQVIAGFNGEPAIIKSKFDEGAEGNLRVSLVAVDKVTSPLNQLQSVTFSVRGKRYDA